MCGPTDRQWIAIRFHLQAYYSSWSYALIPEWAIGQGNTKKEYKTGPALLGYCGCKMAFLKQLNSKRMKCTLFSRNINESLQDLKMCQCDAHVHSTCLRCFSGHCWESSPHEVQEGLWDHRTVEFLAFFKKKTPKFSLTFWRGKVKRFRKLTIYY